MSGGETIMRKPVEIYRVEYDDPCSGCGVNFTPGDLSMVSTDSTDFFCFSCVAVAYEAMKAVQS